MKAQMDGRTDGRTEKDLILIESTDRTNIAKLPYIYIFPFYYRHNYIF